MPMRCKAETTRGRESYVVAIFKGGMSTGELRDVPLGNVFVHAQHLYIVGAADGLVLHQCHVRHSDKGWNRVAYSQFGSPAPRLFLVKKTIHGNFGHKVPKKVCTFRSVDCSVLHK